MVLFWFWLNLFQAKLKYHKIMETVISTDQRIIDKFLLDAGSIVIPVYSFNRL